MTTLSANPSPILATDLAGPPKESTISLKALSQFIKSQYDAGLSRRRPHAVSWIQVQSILKGIHYFEIDEYGQWFPIEREEGEIRAIVPVMVPLYQHALGILNANEVGVSTTPIAGSVNPIYNADRVEKILTHWLEETRVETVKDHQNQILLTEGMTALHRYIDRFRGNAYVRALPQSELFPIPFDAKIWEETHGMIHASMVTKQFLEEQDRIALAQWNQGDKQTPRPRSMADRASGKSIGMRLDMPQVGASTGSKGKFDGALVMTVWMKPTEENPRGQYIFMVEDEIFRHSVGQELRAVMPDGKIPLSPIYFRKQPHSFWGHGLCESVLPSQFSMNRQMTTLEKNARLNRPFTFYDSDVVGVNDMQSEDDPMIPFRGNKLAIRNGRPAFHFPASTTSGDVGTILTLNNSFADAAAGMRSPVIFGVQSGRTDSAAATNTLGQNAMASFTPVLQRTFEAYAETYPAILDMIKLVWPPEKKIRVSGSRSLGKEILIQREQIPTADSVIITPRALLPGGTQTLTNILFQLKGMPGPDGKQGTLLERGEFMTSLKALKLLPPGIDASSRPEARVQTRIDLLINDGQKPAIPPANIQNNQSEIQIMEDHRVSLELLKDVILDESFKLYGKPVQQALMMELNYHLQQTMGATEHPGNVDDDLDKIDSRFSEEFLAAAEADFETTEGDFLSQI